MATRFFREPGPAWKQGFDADPSVIYLMDEDLRIVRCNPAWDRFAMANDGLQAISSKIVGTRLMDVVPPALHDFYRAAYATVRSAQRDWWHVFECPSPTVARVFQMRILPSGDGGVLTVNTLISEEPHVNGNGIRRNYTDCDGIVTMCAHCRRVKRLDESGQWDWFPELLVRGAVLVSHGLCPFCTAYHYHRQ
ncbi:MAG TPA: PAS domain-containing protein [Bryobacteraceae bacterium]|nr:PAS domain-containing protein [Bryobacteraceae bacterium]